MAWYLVKAMPHDLGELRQRIDSGEISTLRPFGTSLHDSLSRARLTPDGNAVWEEECYCSPPLKQERSVLDRYFSDLTTQPVREGDGWGQISDLPSLWRDQGVELP